MRALALLLPLVVVAADGRFRPQPAVVANDPQIHAEAAVGDTQFVPNLGQWHPDVRYAVFGDTAGWLHDDGFTLRLERWEATADECVRAPRASAGCVVRTRFLDAATTAFVPAEELATRRHFFLGDDAARWRSDVPSYRRVAMQGAWPGIDVAFRPLPAPARGAFEYDLLLAPNADLTRFAARCEGVDALAIDADGRLRASVRGHGTTHELVQEPPIAWQDTPRGRRPLRVAFRLLDATTYGFVAPDLDPTFAATVDPGVVWGTFLGGGSSDRIHAMRWREGVGVWVAGWAGSTDFPVTPGAFRATGGADAFVAKLSDDGDSLQFATYLGGNRGEEVRGLDLGPGDTPTVVGYTQSTNFPVTATALQPSFGGSSPFLDLGDAFVVRLQANGAALLASTYYGGVFDDVAEAVVVESNGDAVVAGWSSSPNLQTTPGAFQPTVAGIPGANSDGFVARFAANGQSLGYATLCGGSLNEVFVALDRDPATGQAIAAGWTISFDFPTTAAAVRPNPLGEADGVVVRFGANGGSLVWSSFFGSQQNDYCLCVDAAADGTVWIGGATNSTVFPVTLNAPQLTPAGEFDGFVTQLSGNGQNIVYSTLLGGSNQDRVRGIDAAAGGIAVAGEAGLGFPVTPNADQPVFAGGNLDAFLVYLTNGGGTLDYASYFGGTENQDVFDCVDVTDGGLAVVSGWSYATDFPISPAGYQSSLVGVEDGVVMKFDFVSSFGDGLSIAAEAVDAVVPAEVGERELLGAVLQNLTARELVVDAVRVHVGGAGDARARLSALRVRRELAGAPAVLVAGPVAPAVDDGEMTIPLVGCTVPPSATVVLRFVGDVAADPSGAATEFVVTAVAADAWTIRAAGAGPGPEVRVAAPGRARGPVVLLGEIPGDVDGDRGWSVIDVRRQLATLGSAVAATDCDGDGLVSVSDVAATRQALLGRATLFGVPSAVARGAWFTVRGVFPDRAVEATLGGAVLRIASATPREACWFVPAGAPTGMQELVLSAGGRVLVATLVLVQ